jgi:hypothetical protein
MKLSFIRGLYDVSGPWASVYMDATHDTESARAAVKIRWKNLRDSVREGIDEQTLHALEVELIDDQTFRALERVESEERPHPGRHGLAMFAAHGEVRHVEIMSEPLRGDLAEASPLPFVTPLLSQRGEQVPWLRVIVNRVGADIEDPAHDTIRVDGTHLSPIRKTHGGGWSQEHLHRKAELRWQHNARDVAEHVDRLADSVGAELVIVAGDVRARRLLIDRLPERWRERVVEIEDGSRAPGADLTSVDRATSQAVATAAAQRRAAVIDRFRVRGGEYAAAGVPAVVAAFDRSQVETLLLDPDGVAKRQLWVGLDLPHIAGSEDELRQLGARQIQPVRAEDALIRAAAMTDAALTVVSADEVDLDDGVGAVLRYVDPAAHRA